jgi:inorganic triphosphatase YgiF
MTSSPSPPPRELEVKLNCPPGTEAALGAHPVLLVASDAPETRQEITTYFDTPDWDLAGAGASLRVRRRDGHRVQTLKLQGDSGEPFGRGEWEWPVDGDAPDLAPLAGTPAAPLFGAVRSLRPVFTTEVSRTVRILRLDGVVIEASFDQGSVRAGNAVEEISELELELKQGDVGPLYCLAAMLHADVPLTLGTESKADRGRRLRTGRPRDPEKQADILLPHDVAAAEAFRRIIGATLANLLANQPAATSGEIEGVHQMRVAIRRLRAALVLFRPHLEPHAASRFTAELRRLGRVLGDARDWDVFCEETLEAAASDGVAKPWLDLLHRPAEAERVAAHSRLTEMFAGPAFSATVLGLAAWAEDPGVLTGTPDGGALRGPLANLAPALEARMERKALRRGRHIQQRGAKELHTLRKTMKQLRYGVEFLASMHRRKRVKAYLRGCKALQEQLGMINDAAAAVALAERLGGEHQAELAPAVAALAAWAEARRARGRGRLPKAWRAFKAVPLPS